MSFMGATAPSAVRHRSGRLLDKEAHHGAVAEAGGEERQAVGGEGHRLHSPAAVRVALQLDGLLLAGEKARHKNLHPTGSSINIYMTQLLRPWRKFPGGAPSRRGPLRTARCCEGTRQARQGPAGDRSLPGQVSAEPPAYWTHPLCSEAKEAGDWYHQKEITNTSNCPVLAFPSRRCAINWADTIIFSVVFKVLMNKIKSN